jgi:hypothetical protein
VPLPSPLHAYINKKAAGLGILTSQAYELVSDYATMLCKEANTNICVICGVGYEYNALFFLFVLYLSLSFSLFIFILCGYSG